MPFNPVLKNEMKRMARSRQMIWIVVAFDIIMAAAAILIYDQIHLLQTTSGSSPWMNFNIMFTVIITIEICMLTLFVPPIAGGSIAGEYEHQTMEILLSSRLNVKEIITGKLLSSISLALLLLVSCLPVDMMILSFGGITISDMFRPLFYTVFYAFLTGAIGIFFSCLLKRTTASTIASYGLILFLTIGMAALDLALQSFFIILPALRFLNYLIFYLLLLNPALTFSLIVMHIFTSENYIEFFARDMYIPVFVTDHWVFLSVAAQMLLIAALLFFAARKLDPLSRRKRSA